MREIPISELESTLDSECDPIARVDAQLELAWALRARDVGRAHALATEAREQAIARDYKLGQARAARTMAMTVQDEEGLRAVFQLAEEAKRLFDEVGDGTGRAASRDFLASVYEHIGDLTGALDLALDALSIARDIDDPVRQAYALSNVGGILAVSGEVETALERLREALQIFESAADPSGISTIAFRIFRVLKNAGRLEEAANYAEMCRQSAEQTGNEYDHVTALSALAEVEEQRGDSSAAERLYRAAIARLTSRVAKKVIGAEVQVALGRLLLKRGALDDAESELTEALALVASESLSIVNAAAAHEALAELYESRSNLAATIEHFRHAQSLREQIAQREARNKLAQVEARAAIDAAKKDAEIHRLRYVELHAMQSKLVEAERMAFLGKLAAGTAHELNSPLGVLRNNGQLVRKATERLSTLVSADSDIAARAKKLTDAVVSCAQTSDDALARIAAIAKGFERFSHVDQADFCSFDLRESIQSALGLLEPTIPDRVEIVRRLAPVPAVSGWPREINHALMTVLQNAVQSIEGEGRITVETSSSDDTVWVRVGDTGRGMSEQETAHLFDVSWSEIGTRTKMRIGLAAAQATLNKHRGAIEVESVPGKGTTMTFRFPLTYSAD
jgi:two-component system NtrC family sensor kinase